MKPLVLAVGGTGGHIYPAVALGEAVKRMWPEVSVTIAGNPEGREAAAAARYGFGFEPVRVVRMPKDPFAMARFAPALTTAIQDARRALRRLRPGAVVGFGGYVSFPTVTAAVLQRVPVFLQEQNLAVGRANRFLARFAEGVFTSFDSTARQLGNKALCTGNPCRFDGLPVPDRAEARRKLRLDPDRRMLFVFGGSQGAATLNDAVSQFVMTRAQDNLQGLHVSGTVAHEKMKIVYGTAGDFGAVNSPVKLLPYLDEMDLGYAAADLVLCRAGATTITEITCFGVPAILVPYPYATGGHQEENARQLADAGAAVVVPDAELSGEKLQSLVSDLLRNSNTLREMSEKAKALYKPNAAGRMAERLRPYLERQ